MTSTVSLHRVFSGSRPPSTEERVRVAWCQIQVNELPDLVALGLRVPLEDSAGVLRVRHLPPRKIFFDAFGQAKTFSGALGPGQF